MRSVKTIRDAGIVARPNDVVVVGAGIVGLCCGLALQERGLSVTLIDRGEPRGQASFGNAGVISPGSILPLAGPSVWRNFGRYIGGHEAAVRLRWSALAASMPWAIGFLRASNEGSQLRSATALAPFTAAGPSAHIALADRFGLRQYYRYGGWLKLYRDRAAFDAGKRERALLADHGIKAAALSAAELTDLEPSLDARFTHALWITDALSVDSPGAFLERLFESFAAGGGTIRIGVADQIIQEDDQVVVKVGGEGFDGRFGVLAPGAWAKHLLQPLGYRLPLAVERGYHRHIDWRADTRLQRPIHDAGGAYVIAPMGDGVRVTTGVELALIDDPPDFRQLESAVAEARRTLPLGDDVPESTWLGCRPSTPDGLPVIGFAPRHDRIVFAFGHGHIGFATGPITGTIVADLISRRPAPVPIEAFSPDRF